MLASLYFQTLFIAGIFLKWPDFYTVAHFHVLYGSFQTKNSCLLLCIICSKWTIYEVFLPLVLHALLVFFIMSKQLFLAFCHLQMMAGFHPQQRERRLDRVIHNHWVVAGPVLSIPPGLSLWGHRFLTKPNWLVSCKGDLLQLWVIIALCATRECCTSQTGMLQSKVEKLNKSSLNV